MALGDGIRRNIAEVSQVERDRFIAAIRQLDMTRIFPDGVSYWDKQDQIHQATHVHGGPSFLPWHRELCNRFEAMLREVDQDLSLHYWDWTTDPQSSPDGLGGTVNLFTSSFMGSATGRAGAPFDTFDNNNVFAGSRDDTGNPADPPQVITRNLRTGAPSPTNGVPSFKSDADMIITGDTLGSNQQYNAFRNALESMHNNIHSSYIRGTIGPGHSSFEDPFVFLLHSNVDRLWAMWQTQPGKTWRLDPNQTYGDEGTHVRITENLDPWAGGTGTRPWAPPENEQVIKNSKDPSIVRPPCYDTLPTFPPTVTQDTPTINFNDVPAGETTVRAIVFSAIACADVHLSITSGPTVVSGPAGTSFGTILGTSESIQPRAGNTPPKGRLWITYTGTNAGDMATGTVTVHCPETNQDFIIPITANTIARPTVAVCLSLDQSNSMNDPAGTLGATRIQVLLEAASRFVEIVQPNNGVGIVRFDHDAYPGIPITQIGAGIFDPNRVAVLGAVQAHAPNPNGWTSIGDGVALARTTLNPVAGYDHKAIIVFTDGLENRPLSIADVAASIDNRTFAIGLGNETQVSTAALNALTNGTGGYLLLTGQLTASIDDYFRLTKYFLQILAGVTNNNIVRDPNGFIAPGMKLRIPFFLNEADIDCTAILLADLPVIQFMIESPNGDVMDSASAGGLGQTFAVGTNMSYYRFTLPLALGAGAHTGVWHAILTVDKQNFKKHLSRLFDLDPVAYQRAAAHGARYSFTVQTYSNLKMEARLSQNSLQPGATLTLRANLSEYGLPVAQRADVQAELRRPDNTSAELTLTEIEPGVFETSTVAAIQGVYHFHLIASGVTLDGVGFTREQMLTGAVFQGGDNPPPTSGSDPRTRDKQLCGLLECLLGDESLRKYLEERGINSESLAKCFDVFCRDRLAEVPEGITEQLPRGVELETQGTAPRRIATRTTARKAGKKLSRRR